MVMKGVQAYGSLEACITGIHAGLDMFIFRDSDISTLEMIDKLVSVVKKDEVLKQKVMKSYQRILNLKQKYEIL